MDLTTEADGGSLFSDAEDLEGVQDHAERRKLQNKLAQLGGVNRPVASESIILGSDTSHRGKVSPRD